MTAPPQPMECLRCGYDIASIVAARPANEPGVCPECGHSLRHESLLAIPRYLRIARQPSFRNYWLFAPAAIRHPFRIAQQHPLNQNNDAPALWISLCITVVVSALAAPPMSYKTGSASGLFEELLLALWEAMRTAFLCVLGAGVLILVGWVCALAAPTSRQMSIAYAAADVASPWFVFVLLASHISSFAEQSADPYLNLAGRAFHWLVMLWPLFVTIGAAVVLAKREERATHGRSASKPAPAPIPSPDVPTPSDQADRSR